MTEQEMRNRMKEIDNERDKLRAERKEYENYFSDKNLKERIEKHKQYVGKCFIQKNNPYNKQKYIKAFKVLEVLEYPNERYARCITLIEGCESNCWNEKAIKNQVVGLWIPNEHRLMADESDLKLIDFYEEISLEEFKKLYKEYRNYLDDNVCS